MINQIDLNSMDFKSLKELQARVNKAVTTFEDRRKKAAFAELEARARELGFNISDLIVAGAPVKAAKAPKKFAPSTTIYTNPENTNQQWNGRGRSPKWFNAAMEAGFKREELAA